MVDRTPGSAKLPRTSRAEPLAPQDRLQPALLDRLTDDEPDKKTEPREARVLTKRRLRESVLRDLAWLFNATRLEGATRRESAAFAAAPYAQKSVVNFGMPAMAGKVASTLDILDLTKAIREAILTYEPRILPETLEIQTVTEQGLLDHHNVIGVEIHGQLWGQPMPMDFLVRTDIDLETGKVRITDLNAPQRVAPV